MAFLIGFAGYATGLAFIACAIMKPFMPDQVGLWIGPHGFVLGITTPSPYNWMLRFAPRTPRRVASVA